MRIAIVNDVLLAAEALRRALAVMPEHRLAWIAHNGVEAVTQCERDLPDLILMDLIMPVMDGVEATRQIMRNTPCPILVVTATIDGNSEKVFEALSAGALDAVQTPSFVDFGKLDGARTLRFKINTLARQEPETSLFKQSPEPRKMEPAIPGLAKENLVAIGASAGGPAALATVLSGLRSGFPAAIVIVQHLDVQFVPMMISWLNERGRIPVRVAQRGEHPRPGVALLAGTGDHLAFAGTRILDYTAEPRAAPCRPSVDVFFKSIVQRWRGKIVGVLLTGMGRDGAAGLKALRDGGALTIAQDAATSAVYGMPKAAAEMQAATKILPLDRIAPELNNCFPTSTPGI